MPPATLPSRVVVVDGVALPELTICSWPLRDEPVAAAVVLLMAAGVSITAAVVARSYLVGVASALALLLALRSWWLPAEFHVNELGVKRTTWGRSQRTPWREIAAYELCASGVLLLADSEASPLGLLRGIYVPYQTQRTALMAMVEQHLPGVVREPAGEGVVRQPRSNSSA